MLKFKLLPVPHIIHYKNLPENVDGQARTLYVELDKNRSTEATRWHELTHVIQWYIMTVFSSLLLLMISPTLAILGVASHQLLYKFSKKYRAESELMAFGAAVSRLTPSERDNYVHNTSKIFTKHYNLPHAKYPPIKVSNKIYNYMHIIIDKMKL